MVVETRQAFVGARLRLSGDNTSFVVRTAGAHTHPSIVGAGIFPGAHAALRVFCTHTEDTSVCVCDDAAFASRDDIDGRSWKLRMCEPLARHGPHN